MILLPTKIITKIEDSDRRTLLMIFGKSPRKTLSATQGRKKALIQVEVEALELEVILSAA